MLACACASRLRIHPLFKISSFCLFVFIFYFLDDLFIGMIRGGFAQGISLVISTFPRWGGSLSALGLEDTSFMN